MKRQLTLLLAGLLITNAAASSQAAVALPPGALWEYTFTDPTGDATWNTTTGGWATGAAPFSNVSSGDFAANTGWPADGSGSRADDLWVRRTVNLSGYDMSSIVYDLGVDNGFKLYFNGNLVASDDAEGFTFRWEYSGGVPSSSLNGGLNVIALALEDHGGLTAFDMQVTGRQSMPDAGATALLLGFGLAALAGTRRVIAPKA